MTMGDNEDREQPDAVHIRFREKELPVKYFCFACYEEFQATSILEVFQHYTEKQHSTYHSDCLYCHGKVYQYRDGSQHLQYFHNCLRWKRGIERWSPRNTFFLYIFIVISCTIFPLNIPCPQISIFMNGTQKTESTISI